MSHLELFLGRIKLKCKSHMMQVFESPVSGAFLSTHETVQKNQVLFFFNYIYLLFELICDLILSILMSFCTKFFYATSFVSFSYIFISFIFFFFFFFFLKIIWHPLF